MTMVPFHDEQVHSSSLPQSRRNHKQDQLETSDSQNTSVNIMRRTSSFKSTKSSFSGKSENQFSCVNIEFNEVLSVAKVNDVIAITATELYYQKEHSRSNQIILTKFMPQTWKQLYCCCFNFGSDSEVVIVIQFKSDILNSKKSMQIKLLEGSFVNFEQLVSVIEDKLKNIQIKHTLSSSILIPENKQNEQTSLLSTSDYQQSPFCMQRKGYIVVQRLLKKNYPSCISKLRQSIKLLKPRVISKSLNLIELVNQLLRTINRIYEEIYKSLSLYNYDIIYYSIQKYICEQILPQIKEIYEERLKQQQLLFLQKRHRILNEWENADIIKYLQIKPQFQLIQEGASSSYVPYQLAINKLSTFHLNLSLRQKLRAVQEYYSALKVSCYEFHRGKLEISTMDDILPVIIYTVIKANVSGFYPQLKMIDDYAKASGRFEGDLRVITNLFVGLEYASKEWVLD